MNESTRSKNELAQLLVGRRRRPERQRRTPEEARAEILLAAHKVLDEVPFREVTVDILMQNCALSRSSFYVYFHDRHDVIRALVADILKEVDLFAETWILHDHGVAGLKHALTNVRLTYFKHGRIMKALADGASSDLELETIHSKLISVLVQGTERGILREQASGQSVVSNAREVAKALVMMTERIANETWGRAQASAPSQDTLDSLIHVWCWSIYGRAPDGARNEGDGR